MKSVAELDAMYAALAKDCKPLIPQYDPKIHGLIATDFADKRGCSIWTARRMAEANVKRGRWVATLVRKGNHNMFAYRPKGGAK